MARHPFKIDAFVLLPDHLHCIWTLPEGDSDFSPTPAQLARWRLIKSAFTRACSDSSWDHLRIAATEGGAGG